MVDKPTLLNVLAGHSLINGLFDNCTVLPNGGSGVFSVVCRANHMTSKRPLALKFQATTDPYRQLCFKREADLLASLVGERRIIQLVEAPQLFTFTVTASSGSAPVQWSVSCPFLPLEWMDRGDLSNRCAAAKSRDAFLERLELFRDTCKAVRRLHSKKIFHRDLKPDNFLISSKEGLKVSDLGTSRLVAKGQAPLLPAYSSPVGDFRYTAPEMLAGLHSDPDLFEGADTYSLGAILFELLTGFQLSALSIGKIADIHKFIATFTVIPEVQRRKTFERYLDGERTSRVPNLWTINPLLPKCTKEMVTRLVEGMAHYDFRKRAKDWDTIFRLLDMCMRVTRNEENYLKMLDRRRAARQREMRNA